MSIPDSENRRSWRTAIIEVLQAAEEPLHYDEIATRVINAGFRTIGKTPAKTVSRELTTHPHLFSKVSDGTYQLVAPLSVDTPVSAEESRIISRQGFRADAGVRRIIESYAMQHAITYFEELEWAVADVSRTKPFDLLCTKPTGMRLSLEVKGTATEGQQILLTRNEVDFAKMHYPNVALYILAKIAVVESGASLIATGGNARVVSPWDIRDGVLAPITYSYAPSLPPSVHGRR